MTMNWRDKVPSYNKILIIKHRRNYRILKPKTLESNVRTKFSSELL